MEIGKLNCLVAIQAQSTEHDGAGQPVVAWSTVASVWADIRRLSGVEAIKAGAETSIVKASIRIRWRTDVTAAMRVVHGATVYEVKAVLPDDQGREHVDLLCEVVT